MLSWTQPIFGAIFRNRQPSEGLDNLYFCLLVSKCRIQAQQPLQNMATVEWWGQMLTEGLYLLLVPDVQCHHISNIQRRWLSHLTHYYNPDFNSFQIVCWEYAFSNKAHSKLSLWQHMDHHSSSWKPPFLAEGSVYSNTPTQVRKSLQDRMIHGIEYCCGERSILTRACMCSNVLQLPTVLSS